MNVKPEKAFLAEWLDRQSPEIQEMYNNNPKALKNYILKQILLRRKFPSCDFIPNIAQDRATKCYRKPNPRTNNYPKYMIFTGGNGVGKTCSMAMLIVGVSLGNKYLNHKYYNYQYFDDCEKIRLERPLAVRIICDKSDVEENGSVYQQIRKWIPHAKWSGKTDGHYTTIKIVHPEKDKGYKTTVIDIKTHNMDEVSFSGSDCDLIIFNEPLKSKVKFQECVGRLRLGGRMALFLTPLKGVAYLHKMIHDPRNRHRLYHAKGAIWDNCKDIEGTRGVLSKEDIEDLKAGWRDDPATLKAREFGEFIFLEGAVFVKYNSEVHVEEPEDFIDLRWNMVQIVDPHGSKSDVSVWMALDPLNTWRIVAEYPTEPWDELGNSDKTIEMFGYDFKLIESGRVGKFKYLRGMPKVSKRIGDPNAFGTPQKHNKKTIQWQYKQDTGFFYNTNVDNSIELRHDKIKKLIQYDTERELGASNFPRLLIWSTCYNVQRAFINYCLGDNGKPLEDWKDWIDAIGYGVTTVDCWEYQKPDSETDTLTNEYMEIERGMHRPIDESDMSPTGVEVIIS